MSNKYCFDIPDGGDSPHNILDYCFNNSTQDFLLKSGLKEGMAVLECGCGSGVMSSWVADQVGANGQLLAIDSSQEQLVSANKLSQDNEHNHVTFVHQDVYDIHELDQTFDLVYCRFILHHLERPREVITKMLALLKPGGIIHLKTDSRLLTNYTLEQIEENGYKLLNHSFRVHQEIEKFPKHIQKALEMETYFETLWRSKGYSINYVAFTL